MPVAVRPMNQRIAVIGGGMAGLAAGFLAHRAGCQVVVFEARQGFGMDAHALSLHGGRVDVPLRVMSREGWRSVLALAADVGVATFGVDTHVSCSRGEGRSWFRSGRLPLTGWPFVGSWRYLNRDALRVALGMAKLSRATRAIPADAHSASLQDFLENEHIDPLIWRGLVLPLLITICTCDEADLLRWPAAQLLAMLDQIMHGPRLLRLQGGTSALASALARDLEHCSGSPVACVQEQDSRVLVRNARGDGGLFDRVIVATQANQLGFLQDQAQHTEREVLADIRYASGELVVHADERFLPRARRDWTALNFRTDEDLRRAMFTVWVNAVEPSLTGRPVVLQTWNPLFAPQERCVHARVPLQRAVVHSGTAAILRQLEDWHRQPGRRIFYCGSWAHPGVPLLETAVRSARTVVDLVLRDTLQGKQLPPPTEPSPVEPARQTGH
jgi:predicted NAD/FAD-binding protein